MSFNGKFITDATITKGKLNLVDPVNNLDPATKQWVLSMIDQAIWNQPWKAPVRVAVSSNINIANPGTAVFDGVTISTGQSVLLYGQTTGSQNGPYVFNGNAVAMTRRTDFDTSAEALDGALFPVQEGTKAEKAMQLATNAPITLGTTALVFADFFPAASSAVLTLSNKEMACANTVNDGDVACNTAMAATPASDSFVIVVIGGAYHPSIGDGVKTKDCYFSADAGVTAKTIANIAAGDKLYWNGSIAGVQLATTDNINYYYQV